VDIALIAKRVDAVRRAAAERDSRNQLVYDVRAGKTEQVMPGSFPDAWPKPIVANQVDVAARQLAENLAPLPAINCATGILTSDRAKAFASKRTKIAYSYVLDSRLRKKMPQACDWYISYGMLPIVIEPDFHSGRPTMRFDNPLKTYPQWNLKGELISYTKVWREEAWKLANKFPELAQTILADKDAPPWAKGNGDQMLECVKYCDRDSYVLYLPERSNLVLSQVDNHFGKVPVAIAVKPSYDDQARGQFDDVIWVQLARAKMAMLGLQATQQTVRAPLAIPTDVQKIPFGDDAIIRTNSPEKIRRVGQDIPAAAFQQDQVLAEELMRGSRTPAAATGDIHASIITGKGVEAMGQGYDVQIATGQTIIGAALEEALALCFEMDEKYWPDAEKEIRGVINGAPFQAKYKPTRDIKGDYTVSVSYGFASGMNPNQALVFLLQLRGDQLVPRDFVQRQLPMDVNVAELQAQVDSEQVTDALKQGIFSMLSSAGIMAQQGMDPTDTLRKAASIIEMREKGVPMHEAILKAFAPTPSPAGAPQADNGSAAGPGGGGGGPGGGGVLPGQNINTGAPNGIAPGQAQMGPGGRPSLQSLLAGLGANGQPNLRASVMRRVPTG
jgi:hypothetical protein